MTTIETPQLLLSEERAAELLSISPKTLSRYRKSGAIRFVPISMGKGKRTKAMYRPADLQAWIQSALTRQTVDVGE